MGADRVVLSGEDKSWRARFDDSWDPARTNAQMCTLAHRVSATLSRPHWGRAVEVYSITLKATMRSEYKIG